MYEGTPGIGARVSGICLPGGVEKGINKIKYSLPASQKIASCCNGELSKKFYVADLVCFDVIIVELKASTFKTKIDSDQTINYLKSTDLCEGLLVNSGEPGLKWKRFIRSQRLSKASSA